jgi:hypothetical protein
MEEGIANMGSDHKLTVERIFASPQSRVANAKSQLPQERFTLSNT